jgi:hypothetical protein
MSAEEAGARADEYLFATGKQFSACIS